LQFGGYYGNSIPPVRGIQWREARAFAVPDPVDNNIICRRDWVGSIGGTVTRFVERTHQNREVEVWPDYWPGHRRPR